MLTLTSDYQIKMLELTGIRNRYIPLINNIINSWNKNHIPWREDIEIAFEWVIVEYISRIFNKRVINHHNDDLSKFLLSNIPEMELDIRLTLEPVLNIFPNNKIKHIKTLIMGNILIIGIAI